MASIPWDKIKKKYLAGATQREICDEFGICRASLTKKIKAESWQTSRQKVDKRKNENVYLAVSARISKKAASKASAGTDEILRLVSRLVQATDTAIDRYMDNDNAGATQGEQLSSMVKNTIQLYREAYDVPTAAEAEARAIAGERLQLEREKAHPTEDSSITVKLSPELEDLIECQN